MIAPTRRLDILENPMSESFRITKQNKAELIVEVRLRPNLDLKRDDKNGTYKLCVEDVT